MAAVASLVDVAPGMKAGVVVGAELRESLRTARGTFTGCLYL